MDISRRVLVEGHRIGREEPVTEVCVDPGIVLISQRIIHGFP